MLPPNLHSLTQLRNKHDVVSCAVSGKGGFGMDNVFCQVDIFSMIGKLLPAQPGQMIRTPPEQLGLLARQATEVIVDGSCAEKQRADVESLFGYHSPRVKLVVGSCEHDLDALHVFQGRFQRQSI